MSDEFERLLADDEVRAEGRTISGRIMVYGDMANSRRERFERGSLEPAEGVGFNLQHDRSRLIAWTPGGGLDLHDGEDEFRMTASLPPLPFADAVLESIREGRRTGLSVEFRALKERTENGVRVIEKALLRGFALTDRPDYGGARVEARARRRRVWL